MARSLSPSLIRVVCLAVALSATPSAAGAAPLPETRALGNGLKVVLLEDHALPLVAVSLWVGAGSKDEVESSAGYAHYLEHLIQRGTDAAGPFEYTRRAQRWGGSLSVRASYDRTSISTSGVPAALDEMLQAVAGLAFRATLKNTEIDLELGTLSQEIRTYYDRPSSVALLETMRAAFPEHPYRHPTLGHFKSVGTLRSEPILAFYRNLYVANNMALVVAGDFDPRTIMTRLEAAFGSGPKSATLPPRPGAPTTFAGHSDIEKRLEFSEAWTSFAFVGPGYRHPDRPAFEALAAALADSASPLYASVVRDQVGTIAQVSFYGLEDAGLLYVAINPVTPALSYPAAASAMRALASIKKTGFSDTAARDLTGGLLRDAWQRAARLADRADSLGEATLFGGPRYAWDHPLLLKALTAADLNRVAEKYLVPDNMRLVVLVPKATGEIPEEGRNAFHTALDGLRPAAAAASPLGLDASLYPPAESARLDPNAWGNSKADTRLKEPVKSVLRNGFTLVVLEDHRFPMAAASLHLPAGSGSDPAGREGRAGLALRLLGARTAQGLRDLSPDLARRRALTPEAQATRDFLEIRCLGDTADLGVAIEALSRALQSPLPAGDEMVRARQAALASLERADQIPEAIGLDLFHEKVYAGHPYANRPDGTVAGVPSVTEDDLKAFAAESLRPDRVVLAIAGDVEAPAIARQVERLFGGWKPASVPRSPAAGANGGAAAPEKATAASGHALPGDYARQINAPQSHALVGVAGVPLLDPEFRDLRWLGAAVTLRAFEDLVFQRRAAFSVVAIPEGLREGGALAFEAVATHLRRAEAQFDLQRLMRALTLEEIPEAERRDLGRMLAGREAAAAEGTQALASLLAYREAAGLQAALWRAALEPAAPPPARLKALAERLFQPDRFISIVVGPPSP